MRPQGEESPGLGGKVRPVEILRACSTVNVGIGLSFQVGKVKETCRPLLTRWIHGERLRSASQDAP